MSLLRKANPWLWRTPAMLVCLLVSSMAWSAPVPIAPGAAAFERGIAEFQAGNFSAALTDFLSAERGGVQTQQLTYNLAVTHFKLGHYEQARLGFTALASVPEVAPLAHYNLGLVALSMEDAATARKEFERVTREAEDVRLAALARSRLDELQNPAATQPQPGNAQRWFGFTDVSAGYDDNVTFSSSASSLPASQRQSALTSVLAGGGAALTGDLRDGLLLSASAFRVDYFNVSRFTANDGRVGLSYRAHDGDWRSLIGLQGGVATLGGNTLETLGGARVEIDRSFGSTDALSFAYRYEQITGGSRYRYLDGSRQQLMLENTASLGPVILQIGYRLELNDRRDYSLDPEFFSESPMRQRVFSVVRIRLAPALEGRMTARYQYSRYGSADIYASGGVLLTATRADELYDLGAELRVRLGPVFSLSGGYEIEHNDSNIGRFAYLSHRGTVTLHWEPRAEAP